jgi:acyl-CoA thioesterase FadM
MQDDQSSHSIEIRYTSIDAQGHVNHAKYLIYIISCDYHQKSNMPVSNAWDCEQP